MPDTPSPDPFELTPPAVPPHSRAAPRLRPEQSALVSAVTEGFLGRGLVLNVSAVGICCHLHASEGELSTGQEVLLKINFHGRADTLRCVARVAWSIKVDPERPAAHYGFEWIEGADVWAVRQMLELTDGWKPDLN